MKQAAEELRSNPNIVIKKDDKSNVFVIIEKEEYTNKINQILADQTKFKQITRDPTETLQRKVNKLIAAANSQSRNKTLTPIVGSYSTGYIYGNIKTQKNGNPLRPIISQVSTPTYQTSKQLDAIIKPYIPKTYSLNSRDEFIDLLKSSRPDGQLASLDVSSLFTNVPVHEAIDIILGNVYHHPSLPPPSIEKETLKELLLACTTESPFRCPNNKMYYQINGMTMGSGSAPTFADFYMCDLENKVLSNIDIKPSMFCRYVDDIYVAIRNEEHLQHLKHQFEGNSILNFTHEINANKLSFLDFDIEIINNQYNLSVFRKATDSGKCINPKSECPDRYMSSAIRSYIHRAYKTCTSEGNLNV